MSAEKANHAGDVPTSESVVGAEVENNNELTPCVQSTGKSRRVAVLLAIILITSLWNVKQVVVIWRDEPAPGHQHPHAIPAQVGSGSRGAVTPFDLANATVPTDEIRAGGPHKDGIPALTKPAYLKATAADYLNPGDRVVGFVTGSEARAYPLKILNYHEIVNDQVGEQPIAVTYCPLCDSVAVFDRQTPLGLREFGVSGLLYNSNVLMYDRAETKESLWSQLKNEGISGPGARRQLKALPVELTTWQDWLERYPGTLVLASNTGYVRDYQRDPYAGYFERPDLMFPARPLSDRLAAKERVLGVWTDSTARAYPLSAFSHNQQRLTDEIDGQKIVLEYVPASQTLRVVQAPPSVQWMYSLWFAWHAMRPETEIYASEAE